jgi:hypothetical protein
MLALGKQLQAQMKQYSIPAALHQLSMENRSNHISRVPQISLLTGSRILYLLRQNTGHLSTHSELRRRSGLSTGKEPSLDLHTSLQLRKDAWIQSMRWDRRDAEIQESCRIRGIQKRNFFDRVESSRMGADMVRTLLDLAARPIGL